MQVDTVVDLGCYDFDGRADSIGALIREYQPKELFGFDAHPDLKEDEYDRDGCHVRVQRAAAWDHMGTLQVIESGTGTRVGAGIMGGDVPCFDFAEWLHTHGGPVAVKMDIEGAEYVVLEAMKRRDADMLVAELLIEWHGPPVTGLRCPTREWWM